MKKYTITDQEWESVLNKVQTLEKENQRLTGVIEGMEKAFSLYGVTNSLMDEKTNIANWEALKDCSERLRNNIVNIKQFKDGKLQEIKHIEDITKNNFNKTEGLGKKSWREFIYLRGY